jgi:hypothetical protein
LNPRLLPQIQSSKLNKKILSQYVAQPCRAIVWLQSVVPAISGEVKPEAQMAL